MTRGLEPLWIVSRRCGCAWILETGDQVAICCTEHLDAVQLCLPFNA